MLGYPISHEVRKDHVEVIGSGVFLGGKKNVRLLISDLRKDKRTIKLEINGHFCIMYMKQHSANRFIYQPGVFHTKPAMITKEGEYVFELASWEKEKLARIVSAYKVFNAKLHWLKRKRITNVQVTCVSPNLTDKQRTCLELAINEGYYAYPRRTDLRALAKKTKVAYSTFHFHLRTAEKKVMPSVLATI